MSDFLSHLAARALAPEPVIRPRLPGLFEPLGIAAPMLAGYEPEALEVETFRESSAPASALPPPAAPPVPHVDRAAPLPAAPVAEDARTPPPVEPREDAPATEPRPRVSRKPRPPATDTSIPIPIAAASPPPATEIHEPAPVAAEPPSLQAASPPPQPAMSPPRPAETHIEPTPPPSTLPTAVPPAAAIREIRAALATETPAPAPLADGRDERHLVERRIVERRTEVTERPAPDTGATAVELPPAGPPAAVVTVPQITPWVEPLRPVLRSPPPEPSAPTVKVTIGRLEVRATSADRPLRPKRRAAPAVMSLDDYLKQRAGGGR